MQLNRIDLNPLGGIAGDMFAAALFDAFPDRYTDFQHDLKLLGVPGLVAEKRDKQSKGMRACHFNVTQDTDHKPPRTLSAVEDFLTSKELSADVIETACGIYKLLAGAEAAVHGKTIETIHFHEVSDWDSMVDIVAAAGLIARLKCPNWRIGPLPLGGGTINTAHGAIVLPAPATTELLRGYQWIDDGVSGERVTPTGAAIVAYLAPEPMNTPVSPSELLTVGTGCGTRELTDRANVLRATAFASSISTDALEQDQVLQLAFEIDDMTGEELACALDRLRVHEAVLDVASANMAGKKGRVATAVRLLGLPQAEHELVKLCFHETSTLGVRYHTVNRFIVKRDIHIVGGMPVKLAHRPDGSKTAKVESDHLADKALAGRRVLAAIAEGQLLGVHQRGSDD